MGFDTPRELVAAAGFTPFRLGAGLEAEEASLPSNLSTRSRRLLSQILHPGADFAGVAIAHGCAEDVQLFGVLRELDRTGRGPSFPVHFIDLLHGGDAPVTDYNRARLAAFRRWLEALAGRPIAYANLVEAIAAANRRRAAVQRLFARRGLPSPTLGGAAALDLIRALDQSGDTVGDALIEASQAEAAAPLTGARLIVTGSVHEDSALYAAIESAGAVVVGEDHAAGDLWTTAVVDEDLSPMEALAARPQRVPSNGPTASSRARAEALGQIVSRLRPVAVIHLRIGEDEASPWDIKDTRDALAAHAIPLVALSTAGLSAADASEAVKTAVDALLNPTPAPDPATSAIRPPSAGQRPPASSGRRSSKALDCTQDFSAWQRAWFADVRRRAETEPFAVVNADAPQEILRAMDIPYVVNQWWAAIVAAKQKSRDYARRLRSAGYPSNVEAYSAQGLAAALGETDDEAPWGGLPTPDSLALVAGTDAGPKLFAAWARETGARLDVFERSVECRWRPPVEWWDEIPERWSTSLEPERLDLMTAQLEAHAAGLEQATGRLFDRGRLVEVMRLVNEQEDYYRRTRDLIAATRPAPIGIVDSMPATMTPQWHRGSEWGRDAARRLFEEVSERVASGVAACDGERLRLMWVGRGLWGDMGFYQRWEDSHGAVFVWSMYLGLAADGYIRAFEGEQDVMRALAARFLTMGDELRMPTWAGAWHVKEARLHGVDAAIAIDDADPLVLDALRLAGVPVCRVDLNNMVENASDAEAQIAAFLNRLEPSS